jgi:predicted permease
MFKRAISFLGAAARRSRFETDLDAELSDHMQAYAADLTDRGMPRAEAELRARREFGNVPMLKEDCRRSKGLAWTDGIAGDVRFGLRMLRKNPAFALTAILTLALCIGANTAIFSVVDAVLFRQLPYPQPDRLAWISTLQRSPQGESEETSVDGRTWEIIRDHVRSLDVAVYSGGSNGVNLAVSGTGAQYVQQQRVSAGFFRVLGVAPLIGREIQSEEDRPGGPAVAVLSYALWRRAFASDPALVGGKIVLRGEPYTVAGIMPQGFDTTPPADLWTPLRPSTKGEGGGSNYGVVARIRPGYTWKQADAELASIETPLLAQVKSVPGVSMRLHLISWQRALGDEIRSPLLLLWAAVGVVLLIGCVNVAGLMLARGGARRHEIATRLALGSARGRILRQLLTESLLIAIAGAAGGLALGYAALEALKILAVKPLELTQPISIDIRVLAITAVTALLTSILFGLFPALSLTRMDIRTVLAGSGRAVSLRATWSRRGLIVCEVALGMVLLVCAGLVLRSLSYLTNLRAGYDGHNVLTANLSLQDARYSTAASVNHLFDASLQTIRAYPGVEAAGVGLTLPYERALNDGVRVLDGPNPMTENATVNATYVTPGYFEALRFGLLRGRLFENSDAADAQHLAVVNEAFAQRYFRGVDPIGRHLAYGPDVEEIVGVVADVQQRWNWSAPVRVIPGIYVPAAQFSSRGFQIVHTWFSPSWVVRASGPRFAVTQALRQSVASVDAQLPFAQFRSMDEVRFNSFSLQRLEAVLLGTLSGLALLLAAVGIYGLISNSVMERTREIGIRLALGLSAGQAIAAAARPGIVLTTVGIAIGVGLSLGASQSLRALIFGIRPNDLLSFVAAASTLLLVAALASLLPSLRIARVNPAATLRQE